MASAELLIYLLIFLAVLATSQGIYLTLFGKSIRLNNRLNRRLDLLDRGQNREQVLDQLRKELGQHLKARRLPLIGLLADRAQKANLSHSIRKLLLLMAVLALASFVLLGLFAGISLLPRAVLAAAVGIGGVFLWVNRMANKRMALIEEQLPDAVELMVRSLRVGHPFSSALNIVAKEIPDPLGTELGVIADEVAYGRDLGEAMKVMAERIDTQDMRFLAVAVSIQQQSGGNLAEILEGLSKVIRARFKLFRRVKAITAEAKWSGTFLSIFPLAALIAINLIDPEYYDGVIETEYFIPACITVGIFLCANIVVMRILVDIKA